MSTPKDYSASLWLLKLGALLNGYFIVHTASLPANAGIVLAAQFFFAVSAYRCLFPVRYEGNVVLHDTPLSSIFVTRLLATFAEIAYVALFAHVLRALDAAHTEAVTVLSGLMVAQVIFSQVFVWLAVLTGELDLYFYEELGWAVIFAANTAASARLFVGAAVPPGGQGLLLLSLLFGVVYLPWQAMHLRALWAAARRGAETAYPSIPAGKRLADGLKRAIRQRVRRTDAEAWGGAIGLSWMTGYWATLIPAWVYCVVRVLAKVP